MKLDGQHQRGSQHLLESGKGTGKKSEKECYSGASRSRPLLSKPDDQRTYMNVEEDPTTQSSLTSTCAL